MKILQINTLYPQGSTGNICRGIVEACQKENIETLVACAQVGGDNQTNVFEISSWLDHHVHNRLARITMMTGNWSYFRTRRFLKKIKKENVDLIHLHNIHGNFINVKSLFSFIKKNHIPVVWTLHDCWSYTGYCYYYDMAKCDKWKKCCGECPYKNNDSVTVFDNSKKMFLRKKKMFTGVDELVLVTPSLWLSREVLQSFMGKYPVKVINNGIDQNIFKRVSSNFRIEHGINGDDFVLLGVAQGWEKRKGLDVFIKLAASLDEKFKIVLVGTNDNIDKYLPKNIISIHKTQNQKQLAEIYSSANLFVNPTMEENFPTVNLESLSCGTPVLTYNTGGSAEMLDATCGSAIKKGDFEALEKEILRIFLKKPFTVQACIEKAINFNMYDRYKEYVDLYKEILNERSAKG